MTRMENPVNWLKKQAQFSTNEIMPVLEQKISSMMGEEYQIDFFIANNRNNDSLVDVHYLAFPKREAYMKAAFVYENNLYLFAKENRIHETLKTVVSEKYDINHIKSLSMLDLWAFEGNQENNEKIFIIGKETVKSKDAVAYLILPHRPKYHLDNKFFCYGEELDEIGDTIAGFAMQKVPTNK